MTSDAFVQSYQDNGYAILPAFFTQEEVKNAVAAIDQIIDATDQEKNYESEPDDHSVVRRIWSPTQKHEQFWHMATEPQLVDKIEMLIGKNILFHYSKLNMKGPNVGSPIDWHQDYSYYPHTNCSLLTALIFLDDATIENGCLRVIPGSHQHGLYSHEIDGYFRGKVSGIDESKAVNLEVPAGSVVMLHCMTLHASYKNTSNKPRRTFLPAYRAADAYPIYFGPHAAHNEPGVTLIRGERSKIARLEAGSHLLPFAEQKFGSIFDIQEGSHLKKDLRIMEQVGYATHSD